MTELTADPRDLGFDPARLARIDSHFARYVDDGRLAGWQLAVTRRDEVVHAATYGHRDLENKLPVERDTLWRIYSMTKPITSVVAMMLWEEGLLSLDDPISRWIPSFESVRVYDKGSVNDVHTVPALEPVKVWHLLSHTSGLTAGFIQTHVVDALYRKHGFDLVSANDLDLEGTVDALAELPLLFQPGTAWGYGASTDVLGRLIEVVTGQRLDDAIRDRLTGPLGMTDTVWHADDSRADRLAALYVPHPETGQVTRMDTYGQLALREPKLLSGAGGLLSTQADYLRFTTMLSRRGELDGVRILGPRTLALMASNHLPGGADLASVSTGGFSETTLTGVGFGLGFAVIMDPMKVRNTSSTGEYYWGGAASTAFWIDPVEQITATFFTQLLPSSRYPIRSELRQLVYSALVE